MNVGFDDIFSCSSPQAGGFGTEGIPVGEHSSTCVPRGAGAPVSTNVRVQDMDFPPLQSPDRGGADHGPACHGNHGCLPDDKEWCHEAPVCWDRRCNHGASQKAQGTHLSSTVGGHGMRSRWQVSGNRCAVVADANVTDEPEEWMMKWSSLLSCQQQELFLPFPSWSEDALLVAMARRHPTSEVVRDCLVVAWCQVRAHGSENYGTISSGVFF